MDDTTGLDLLMCKIIAAAIVVHRSQWREHRLPGAVGAALNHRGREGK
jgi:hypothetical protein